MQAFSVRVGVTPVGWQLNNRLGLCLPRDAEIIATIRTLHASPD
jgi:hypothetical protein